MKIVLNVAVVLLSLTIGAKAASPFDGRWNVTQVCPDEKEAKSYTFRYVAIVKDGALRGQQGVAGQPGSLTLTGEIKQDGSAKLKAEGLSAAPAFSIANVPSSSPVSFEVEARFEARNGKGSRLSGRKCDFTFAKQ